MASKWFDLSASGMFGEGYKEEVKYAFLLSVLQSLCDGCEAYLNGCIVKGRCAYGC